MSNPMTNRDRVQEEVHRTLPPLQGTEKQVAWASQIRANAITELLKAKSDHSHDEIKFLVLDDIHYETMNECSAGWWISNRQASITQEAWHRYSTRKPYYRFVAECRIKRDAESLVRQFQEAGTEFVDIDAEQTLLGTMLVNNDVCDAVFFLKPEHFCEDLHGRIFEVVRLLFYAGRVATPATLTTYLGDQDLGEVTVSQYLDRLVSVASNVSAVKHLALIIYALSECRSQIEAPDVPA